MRPRLPGTFDASCAGGEIKRCYSQSIVFGAGVSEPSVCILWVLAARLGVNVHVRPVMRSMRCVLPPEPVAAILERAAGQGTQAHRGVIDEITGRQ